MLGSMARGIAYLDAFRERARPMSNRPEDGQLNFLIGGDEVGAMMRAHDYAFTIFSLPGPENEQRSSIGK